MGPKRLMTPSNVGGTALHYPPQSGVESLESGIALGARHLERRQRHAAVRKRHRAQRVGSTAPNLSEDLPRPLPKAGVVRGASLGQRTTLHRRQILSGT